MGAIERLARLSLPFFFLALTSCSSGGGEPPPPAASPSGTVTLTGTVSGTVIWVLNATTDQTVVPRFDTAILNQPPNFPFSFSNIPIGVPLRMFFVTGGAVYPFYVGSTNVFTFTSSGTVDLGLVTTDVASGRATPEFSPVNILNGQEHTPIPPFVIPPTASISVTNPIHQTQVQGPDVSISFAVQNFTIGNQNQAHLHAYLDGDLNNPHEFLSGPPVLKNGVPALNAQWVSSNQIRILGLSSNNDTHTVRFRLSTASHVEHVNPEAATSVQFIVTPPPSNPPTISATTPQDNQLLSFGPVVVSFNVANFAIQGPGQPQLHVYLDGVLYQFLRNPNRVLLNGIPATGVDQVMDSSFRFVSLSAGSHNLRLVLANGDAAGTELMNSSATDVVNFTVDAPLVPTVRVTSNTVFPSSPVRVAFEVTNFTIGLPGTPHLRLSIDGGALHDFYNGTGINSANGVLLNGVHNHAVHWTSTTSFDLFGLAARAYQVRLVLVDGSNAELPGTSVIHNVTVQQPPTGELQLEPVLGGLSLPSALQQAPDGRIFLNERITGNIRVVNQAGSTWQLNPTPFCTVPVEQNGEGLLGLALDPAFSSNEAVYVFYSSASGNRVSRLTRSGVSCVETPILDALPTASIHNGGIIKFGPDGKLYVVIGDADNPTNAQTLTSLAGKVLRVNSDGSAPSNNPFFTNANANAKKVFSLGHRNSFGLTFHPDTGDLWETENGLDDFDEVNRVIGGRNYGWDSSLRSGFLNTAGRENPIVAFPIIAPTGIIAVPAASAIYPPAYRNNLLVAAYIDGSIRLVVPNSSNPSGPGTTSVAYPGGQGGLVGMMLGNDGYVYVSNHDESNPVSGSSIFRVIPH